MADHSRSASHSSQTGRSKTPGIADGIADLQSGTQLTVGWMFRHIRKGGRLLLRQPFKVFSYALRHPKKFFRLHVVKSAKAKQARIDSSEDLAADLKALLSGMEVDFFEVTGPGRIGHMAGEVDLWLREVTLRGRQHRRQVLIMSEQDTANPHFFQYCRRAFHVVITPRIWRWLQQACPGAEASYHKEFDYFHAFDESATCYPIYAEWGDRPPVFTLVQEDKQHLAAELGAWGLKDGDWFVCFHNRERGYSPSDDDDHDYRNARIEDYIPAMQEIVRRGGWVFRMGDPAMTPLPPMERVIDYAHSERRSARLDVELCAAARCVIGCSSGLPIMASAFGTPIVMVNLAPMSIQALTKHDLGMPKLYFSETEQRLLRFDEVLSRPMGNFRFTRLYRESGVKVVDNDSDDILQVTVEMLDRVGGVCDYSEDDNRLESLYAGLFRDGHYGYQSAARTSRAFLKKHRHLLEPESRSA